MNYRVRLMDLLTRLSNVDNAVIASPPPKPFVLIKTPEGTLDLDFTIRWTNLALIQAWVTDSIRDRNLRMTLDYTSRGYNATVRTPKNEYVNNAYDELAAIALLSAYVPFLEAIALVPPSAS